MLRLWFDSGTILLKGPVGTPYGRWDPRTECYRIKSHRYGDVVDFLRESGLEYEDSVGNFPPQETMTGSIKLRDYQSKVFRDWQKVNNRGVLVLPTAAGKTFIALKAIEVLKTSTLIVVPTLDLIDQWRKRLKDNLGLDAGVVGGGEREIRMVTVTTYDSAYLQAASLGNRFNFLVFDEVHHLASPGYMTIAEMYIAPYRMGLTATFERGDQRHLLLDHLIGDIVCDLDVEELTGKHLSPYTYQRVTVNLTPVEQKLYEEKMNIFKDYLRRNRITLRGVGDFHRFIMKTARDPKAREALLARNQAVKIALNSEAKLDFLAQELNVYRDEKVLIFTLYNDLVYRVSRRFLIPAVTHQTPRMERRKILDNFANGDSKAIVTSQVLDEGVDVPEASIGIILSGTGSKREYIQRLGRLLRKVSGKTARLIEVVSKETVEVGLSRRRKKGIGD